MPAATDADQDMATLFGMALGAELPLPLEGPDRADAPPAHDRADDSPSADALPAALPDALPAADALPGPLTVDAEAAAAAYTG